MSTTKTELDRSIYSYYHHWDTVTPFRFIKERPHSPWLRYFSVTTAGHEFPCSAKQRLFLQRGPELKSFALIDWLYFSHFIKWKRALLLDVLVIMGLFSKRGNSYISCPFFQLVPLVQQFCWRGTAYHGLSRSFCVYYTSLCAMELNVNEEITCKEQNRSFLCNKHSFQHYIKR